MLVILSEAFIRDANESAAEGYSSLMRKRRKVPQDTIRKTYAIRSKPKA
jgi:hypothetical protein